MTYEIAHGDVLATLRELPSNSFDALMCDPPYGLSFMGKRWDYDVPSAEVWREALRVLKPGAPLLAFGGTRTFHRMVCAIEDGGFEIRDQIAWIYGSGFPKSQNISIALDKAQGLERPIIGVNTAVNVYEDGKNHKFYVEGEGNPAYGPAKISGPASEIAAEWDGYGTALKPAQEPICVARKPLEGTMAANVVAHGVGGLNIDGTRIGTDEDCARKPSLVKAESPAGMGIGKAMGGNGSDLGRWPANVILDEEAGAVMDAQSGNRPGMSGGGKHAANYSGGMFGAIDSTATARNDSGGASRFFYCAKANRKEREAGCELLPMRAGFEAVEREEGSAGVQNPRAGAGRTAGRVANFHPTVKPLDLCRYLATLIRPPASKDGRAPLLLVPYSGSGSEMIGAMLAGWHDVIGIEGEADYINIAHARIAHWIKRGIAA